MVGAECGVPAPPFHYAGTGLEESFGPFVSYVSRPAASAAPIAAVILASNIYGFRAPLLRLLADKIASFCFLVIVPDYFNNDPYNPDAGISVDEWTMNHDPLDSVNGTKRIVDILKNKGIPSVGAVGFCWGAKVVVELGKEDLLKTVILCHPSRVTVNDIKEVKTPIAILAAENDTITPPSVVKQFAEILESKKEIPSFVKIYPNTTHGWIIRYDVNNPVEVANAEEAQNKIIDWLQKYLL